MKIRPPAIPLFNIDPYFSVWAENGVLKNTAHWTGKPNTMTGRAIVDGKEYHFLGYKGSDENVTDMTVETMEIDAFSTTVIYVTPEIRLTVRMTSPMLIDDLYYASRPVTYCHASYESLDGVENSVLVRFTASEELVLNKKGEGRALAYPACVRGVTAIRMGNGVQKPLNASGDDIRIDWGYLYLGVRGEGSVCHTVLDGMYAISVEASLNNSALFLLAYDDVWSMEYFGDRLSAYWRRDGKTVEEAIAEAAEEYDTLLARCNALSDKIKNDAIEKGGEKYAELLLLAVRQVMAAHKLVVDKNGNNIYISKECFSNGCAATVDVTYPSAPMFLLYNPELLKAMLRPIMDYTKTEEWKFDFAPHDVGQYPLVNGQVYGVERTANKVIVDRNMQMPVEECGNMIILFAAIADAEDNASFAEEHLDTIRTWSKYLIRYGLDPENQLCTDDFAGHLSHNVNLSIKAVMGIAGYSRILARLGESTEAERMMDVAREYACAVEKNALNPDGSYALAYNKKGTFSLKYNSIWDKIWGTRLFSEEFYKGEIARYKRELLPYGVPLDSREKYTKSDWLVWAASLADNREDFLTLVDSLWSAYNTMRTRAPMGDWYYADTSATIYFRHRTVQGGLFIRLMLD